MQVVIKNIAMGKYKAAEKLKPYLKIPEILLPAFLLMPYTTSYQLVILCNIYNLVCRLKYLLDSPNLRP